MNKINRHALLILPLIFILVFNASVCVAYAQEEMNSNTTVNDDIIGLLSALDILTAADKTDFSADIIMTRAEVCAVIVNLAGKKDSPVPAQSIFEDVPVNYWAAGYITELYNTGIINGTGNGLFMPEESATIGMAVKSLVSILGYASKAETRGGYPAGYLLTAFDLGITSGIKSGISTDTKLSKAVLAMMVYNALHTPVLKQEAWGRDPQYSLNDDYILLYDKFNIAKIEGVVDGTSDSTLTGESYLKADEIMISGQTLKYMGNTIKNLYGMRVIAYIRDSKSDKTDEIIYILPSKRNKITKIQAEQLEPQDSQFSETCIVWTEGGKKQRTYVKSSASVLLNGFYFSGYDRSSFNVSNGNLTIVDNDGDESADVVFINTGIVMVTQYIDKSNNRIVSKYPFRDNINTMEVDFGSSEGKLVFQTSSGVSTSAEAINEWDILTVYCDPAGDVRKVIVSNKTVSGQVSEKRQDNQYTYVTIGDQEYKLTRSFANQTFVAVPGVGDEGSLHIDADGEAAAFKYQDILSGNKKFGYLVKLVEEKNIERDLKFKIFDVSGKMQIFDGAKTIEADGVKCSNYTELFNVIKDEQDAVNPQLIIYELNTDGKIRLIDTKKMGPEESGDKNLCFIADKTSSSDAYYKNNGTFGAELGIRTNTVVFQVPNDITKEEIFQIKSAKMFAVGTAYKFYGYGDPDYNLLDAMVLPIGGGEVDWDAEFMMVDKITGAITMDGDTGGKIYGLSQGKMMQLDLEPKIYERWKSVLTRGDIIRYSLNATGQVSGLAKAMYYSDNLPPDLDMDPDTDNSSRIEIELRRDTVCYSQPERNGITWKYYAIYGNAYAQKENKVVIKFGTSSPQKRLLVNILSIKPYVWDKKNDKIYIGSAADIKTDLLAGEGAGSKVFVRVDAIVPEFMAVINE